LGNTELKDRESKAIIRGCIDGLAVYAALVSIDRHSRHEANEIRGFIENLAQYWGLDAGENAKSVDIILRAFDDKVDIVMSKKLDADTYTACADSLTGLSHHGMELIVCQGSDVMDEIVQVCDLLYEVSDYFDYPQEVTYAADSIKQYYNSIRAMLQEYDIPGNEIEGDNVQGYSVKRAVLYDNSRGFAFAHNPDAVSPYVTWRMYNDNGKLEYESGNYYGDEVKALVDYISRAKRYAIMENVEEIPIPMEALPPQLKQLIKFIDSDYRELFQIPDGDSIRITYPPEDGRSPVDYPCVFLDEYHAVYNSATYHICQFAEIMEKLGATYEPANQLENLKVYPYNSEPGEKVYYSRNREDGNTCAGSLHGDFGNDGERYYAQWSGRDNGLFTPEIQSELQAVVYALRKDLLKDRAAMLDYCENHPGANLSSGEGSNSRDFAVYGFKLETEARQYFVNCYIDENVKNSRFTIFAYADKPVPTLEQGSERPVKNELKTYYAEYSDPEIPDRVEIIKAKDDDDAIKQAYGYCAEADEITLLKLNELHNMDSNIVREVDLRDADAELPEPMAKTSIGSTDKRDAGEQAKNVKMKPQPQEKPGSTVKQKKHNRDAR
jgi:hypothetical protein